MIYTVKGFGIVNKAEVDVFLELSCFFNDPAEFDNLISGPSAFFKSSLNIWKFLVHRLLKPGLENFQHYGMTQNSCTTLKSKSIQSLPPSESLATHTLTIFIILPSSDYAKAFDCVDHNKLWKILQEMEISDHLTCLLRNLYAGQEATVLKATQNGTTKWFQIRKVVHQGYI